MDECVNFYFHWLRVFGGWLVILILVGLPTLWLFKESELRLLPARFWRLEMMLTFFFFLPTGTRTNGRRLRDERRYVREGDLITVGDYSFRFEDIGN